MTRNILLFLMCTFLQYTHSTAGNIFIPRKIIDSPTAGNPAQGAYHLDFKILPGGIIQGEFILGLFDRLYVGIAYGGSNLIGAGKMTANQGIGLLSQIRILDENLALPALAVGYSNQSVGPYQSSNGLYHIHAKGIYLVASKNYRLLGNLGFHTGINYRIEEQDPHSNIFFMLNKDISSELSFSFEYDAALNDNALEFGYLNTGITWILSNRLQLEFDIKDILGHTRFLDANRELRIIYMEHF